MGIMSGTSLDGVDLALCTFSFEGDKPSYSIQKAQTVPYSTEWKTRLRAIEKGSAEELAKLHADYGRFLGELSKDFLKGVEADLISSHGHTIFHQPENGFTLQVGSGAGIAAVSGFPVVCDFRSTDVALGGHGAPLVPVGDKLLFSEYSYCLNLGGIANISFDSGLDRVAYDICPVNLVLNQLASEKGLEYDKGGAIASSGMLLPKLLEALNNLAYYSKPSPKSIGKEWVDLEVIPLLKQYQNESLNDRIHTVCHHIAYQIARAVVSQGDLLVTGGGAYNDFLISLLKDKVKAKIVVPDNRTIEFKEALIFAFLGALRWREEINTLGTVTGAAKDSCGGCIYK